MNRRYAFPLLLLCATLLSGCGSKSILDATTTFDGGIWFRFKPEKYIFTVPSAEDCYNIDLTTVIDTSRYCEDALPVILTLASPEGETRTMFYTVILRNRSGNFLGEFSDEGRLVCHSRIREYFYFNTEGQFSIEFGQRTHKYQIEGIESTRLQITKGKLPEIE